MPAAVSEYTLAGSVTGGMPGSTSTAGVAGAVLAGGRDVDAAAEWWACVSSADPRAAEEHPASTVRASGATASRASLHAMNRILHVRRGGMRPPCQPIRGSARAPRRRRSCSALRGTGADLARLRQDAAVD